MVKEHGSVDLMVVVLEQLLGVVMAHELEVVMG